jgi:hypothetical protein
MIQIIEKFRAFEKELESNKLVVKEKFELVTQPADPALLAVQRELNRIEPSVLDYYEIANGINIKWKAADETLVSHEIVGSIKVNPFTQVVKDWSGVVFFEKDPMDSPRRKFFPLDFFADEAAVGFSTLEGSRDRLYLYQFEGDLIPLDVNFKSYLTLMLQAKGCVYWQYLILEIKENEENEVSKRIKQFLPAVFPDFSFDKFKSSYSQLMVKN